MFRVFDVFGTHGEDQTSEKKDDRGKTKDHTKDTKEENGPARQYCQFVVFELVAVDAWDDNDRWCRWGVCRASTTKGPRRRDEGAQWEEEAKDGDVDDVDQHQHQQNENDRERGRRRRVLE